MIRLLALPMLGVLLLAVAPAMPAPAPSPSPLNFTIRGVDDDMDLHGDPDRPDLVIFAAGNQWMVLPDVIAAFKKMHPEVHDVFYETLPPGILAEQMATGEELRIGELLIDVQPDVYLAGKSRMEREHAAGAVGDPVAYASNDLQLWCGLGIRSTSYR